MSFNDYNKDLLPPWCLTSDKLPYFTTMAAQEDAIASAAVDALQDSFIQTAPVDALSHIGSTDNIERPENFTDAQYRAKLQSVWTRWNKSGTPDLLIQEIKDLGFMGQVGIVPVFVETAPGVWINYLGIPDTVGTADPGGMPDFWSSFWIVINGTGIYSKVLWGKFTWGDGTAWGDVTGTPADLDKLSRMIQIIRQLKPAWTSCRGIIIIFDPGKIWDGFNWGAPGAKYGLSGNYGVIRLIEPWEANTHSPPFV